MTSMSGAMGAGSASSYFEKDNYYLKDGLTERGEWYGKGAERLGLSGEISMDQFKALAHGYDHSKLDSEHLKTLDQFAKTEASLAYQMNQAMKAGNDVKAGELQTKINEFNDIKAKFDKSLPDGAKLVKDGKGDHNMTTHRGGFDITFSAPKSVSVMALAGDDKRLITVHQDAVKTAMSHIQENFAQTRVRNGDMTRERVNTGELSVAQFTHYTARGVDGQTPDPQLHTHNFIFNITHEDGKAMSLEPQQIYAHQKLADQIYQNELARSVEKLGYAVEWEKHGQNYTMQIKGVDKEMMDHFSKRDDQITAHQKATENKLGRELSGKEKELTKLETRSDKEVGNIETIKENWSEQMREKGYATELDKNIVSDQNNIQDAKTAINDAVRNLDDQKSVFSKQEILFEALKVSRGQISINELKDSLSKDPTNAVSLNATDAKNSKTDLYTSQDILKAERNIIDGLERTQGQSKELMTKEKFEESIKDREPFSKLTDGQKEAVSLIATSNDRFIGVQGAAGSGKTSMLVELKSILDKEETGTKLIGLAATGKAAAEIQEKGIESKTLDSFFSKPLEKMEKNSPGNRQVWIVDEASMLDTKKFNEVVDRAEALHAKVVFIGDTKQLKAVQAGDMFSKAQESGLMQTAKMEDSVRQNRAADGVKDIVATFRDIERVKEGMGKLEQSGRIVEAEKSIDENGKETRDLNAVKDKLVENAVKDYSNNGLDSTILLTSTNTEKTEFNERIRNELKANGTITGEDKTVKILESKSLSRLDSRLAMSYEKGDILISKGMQGDIKAGMRTEIVGIDKEQNQLKLQYEAANGEIKEKWIDAEKGEKFNAYREIEKEFAAGDKITFTKNDKDIDVKNGETAIVKSINEDGTFTVNKGGKEMSFDSKEYQHIDTAYAMTTYKSQGQSVENVHVFATSDQGMNNHNAGYVQVSRTTNEVTLYTDNKEALTEKYSNEQIKENAIDYLSATTTDKVDNVQSEKTEIDSKNDFIESRTSIDDRIDELTAKYSNDDAKMDGYTDEMTKNLDDEGSYNKATERSK